MITPAELIAKALPVLPALITQLDGVSPVAETVITVAPDEASSFTVEDCPLGIVTSESVIVTTISFAVCVLVPSDTVTVRV